MFRYHDIWDAELQRQIRVQFTAEEEAARDVEEVNNRAVSIVQTAREARVETLRADLVADTLDLAGMRELMRLERGL